MPSVKQLNQYDPFGMHKIYDEWPKIAKESYQTEYILTDFDDINHIVFCGIGGTGAVCDLLTLILSRTELHVNVVEGYLFPKIQ